MTLGERTVELTIKDVIGKAIKPSTKRIIHRCLPALSSIIDEVASEEAGKLALPACYGRHVIFASHSRGMVVDMLRWSTPIIDKGLNPEDPGDRAAMWAEMATSIHKANVGAALLLLATRLGPKGIADFDAVFARLDNSMGHIVFEVGPDTMITARGVLIVLAGVQSGASSGIIGALPVPVLTKPGSVADWHEVDWGADGNHRQLH
jgi:hypothetical protein